MSANINVYDSSANKLKSEKYEVNFVDEINLGLLHQVAISSRTNNRNRTASTKNRAQVSGQVQNLGCKKELDVQEQGL